MAERGALISGVAVDDVNSELALWIGVTLYEDGEVDRTGLGSYPVGRCSSMTTDRF